MSSCFPIIDNAKEKTAPSPLSDREVLPILRFDPFQYIPFTMIYSASTQRTEHHFKYLMLTLPQRAINPEEVEAIVVAEGRILQRGRLMSLVSQVDIETIKTSGMFNENWYRERYQDVEILGMDPIEHYLWIGTRLARDPGPEFSTSYYLHHNPDVVAAGINPFIHYIKNGKREGRLSGPSGVPLKAEFIAGKKKVDEKSPTILLCAHEAHQQIFGGERSFIDMLTALSGLPLNVFVTLPQLNNEAYLEILTGLSAGVYSFPYPVWRKGLPPDRRSINEFKDIIDERNVSIVYANTIMLREPQIAARKAGIHSFCHARELVFEDKHLLARVGKTGEAIVADVMKRSSKVIANSRATQSMFSMEPDKVVYAPNVVDGELLDIPNVLTEKVVFGLISSNVPKKGLSDLVALARRCEQEVPQASFVGIGPVNAHVQELTLEGLPRNLTFPGYAETPVDAISQVNVVLSLSHFSESFGRTVAEGLAARRPIIAYSRGAVPELISDGRSGYLVPPGDINAVVQAVGELVSDREKLKAMGDCGRSDMLRLYSPDVLRAALSSAVTSQLSEPTATPSTPSDETLLLARTNGQRSVTVIVPIYNAYDDVSVCLASLAKHTKKDECRILMLDDASPDARISGLLNEFEKKYGFSHYRNPVNLGYTASCNVGLKFAGDDDVVLLNSDTIVTPNWLSGLTTVAYSSGEIGTVTAMSDNAGAFSFPVANQRNEKPEAVSHDLWASCVVNVTKYSPPIEVPTGNGFCLFIKREVIKKIGDFDVVAFPRGYGEENEFCMRALANGFKSVISPLSYVFHERSKSFGASKEANIQAGAAALDKMYPSYKAKVRKAFAADGIVKLRKLASKPFADKRIFQIRPDSYDEGERLSAMNNSLIDWDGLTTMKRNADKTSIVICMFNRLKLTLTCLDSIAENSKNVEVILVDNGSQPDVSEELDDRIKSYPFIKVVRTFENLNFALGNNVGFAATTGENVVFLNNDTEVCKGWLDGLVAELKDPTVLGAQPKLVYPDGLIQCAGVTFTAKSTIGYALYANQPDTEKHAGRRRRVKAVTAACFAVRAKDFARVRGFDPVFLNGQEDVDICLRLGHGNPVFSYVPSSLVIHHEGKTPGRGKHVLANRRKFVDRWKGKISADDLWLYYEDGLVPTGYKVDSLDLDAEGIALWVPTSMVEVASLSETT